MDMENGEGGVQDGSEVLDQVRSSTLKSSSYSHASIVSWRHYWEMRTPPTVDLSHKLNISTSSQDSHAVIIFAIYSFGPKRDPSISNSLT